MLHERRIRCPGQRLGHLSVCSALVLLLLIGLAFGAGWYGLVHTPRAWESFNRRMAEGSLPEPPAEPVHPKPALIPATEPEAMLADTVTNGATPGTQATGVGALASEPTPVAALEQARRALRLYASMFGEPPAGTNVDITSALNGRNPKHVNFLRPEAGLRLNEKGELVDLWGTPYAFRPLSPTHMEIRSAGPDRVMGTPDDLVVR